MLDFGIWGSFSGGDWMIGYKIFYLFSFLFVWLYVGSVWESGGFGSDVWSVWGCLRRWYVEFYEFKVMCWVF